QWRLQKAGYLPAGFTSQLQLSGGQVEDLFFDNLKIRRTPDNAFPLFPVAWNSGIPKRTLVQVKLNQTPAPTQRKEGESASVVNDGYIQLYAAQAGDVNIKVNHVNSGSAYVG